MKRFISVLLTLVILLSSVAAMSVSASALTFTKNGTCTADNYPGTVEWELSVDTKKDTMKLVFSGDGYMANLPTMPWIADEARWVALYGAALTEIEIKEGVKSIAENAFSEEIYVEAITLPTTLEAIGDYAFAMTSIKSVTLPKSLTNMSATAFASCDDFEEYKVDSENAVYSAKDGMLLSKDGTKLISYPGMLWADDDGTAVAIPSSVNEIGSYAFAGSGITSVVIPSTVKKLDAMSFCASSVLSNVIIENGLQEIGESSFLYCDYLTELYIPESVTSVGWWSVGYTQVLDVDGIKMVLDDTGIKYENKPVDDLEYWVNMVAANLTNYSVDDFVMNVPNTDFTVYGKAGSAAEFYCASTYPAMKFVAQNVCPASLYTAYENKGAIKINWFASSDVDGFKVYRKADSGEYKLISTITDKTCRSFTDAAPVGGAFNTYAVASYKGDDISILSDSADSVYYLATPKLVSAVNSLSGVTVKWKAVKGAEHYVVYKKIPGKTGWKIIGETTAANTSCLDTGAENAVNYVYTIRATKQVNQPIGDDEEGASYSYICRSYYDTKGVKTRFISAPKVSSVSNATNGVTVKWNKISGATGYIVYRKVFGGTYAKIATLTGSSAVSYTDKKAKKGVKYGYTVKAYYGKDITYISASNTGRSITVLSVPSLVSAKSSKSGITFKWNKVAGATGYYVYRKTANSGWKRIATVNGNAKISYLDKSAKKGTTYTYTVRAFAGNSKSLYVTKGIKCKDLY